MSSLELKELRKISKILLLANSEVVDKELSKFATTNERKRMWVLINGERMPKDIATTARVTPQAVSNFLNIGKAAELIEYDPRGPPRRILDYVPPSWLELMEPQKADDGQSENRSSAEKQTSQAAKAINESGTHSSPSRDV